MSLRSAKLVKLRVGRKPQLGSGKALVSAKD